MENHIYIPAKPNGVYAHTVDSVWITPFLSRKLQFLLNLRFKFREEKNYEKADRVKKILFNFFVKNLKDIQDGIQVQLRHKQFKYHTLWFELDIKNGIYDFQHTKIMNYSEGSYWDARYPHTMLFEHINAIVDVMWYHERDKRFENNENWGEMFHNPNIHSWLVDKYKNGEISWFRVKIDKPKKV